MSASSPVRAPKSIILCHSHIKLRFRIEKVNVIRINPLLILIKEKENQAQMAQNRMMNLSSSQELLHLKPKAFRPSWLLPVKSIQF